MIGCSRRGVRLALVYNVASCRSWGDVISWAYRVDPIGFWRRFGGVDVESVV